MATAPRAGRSMAREQAPTSRFADRCRYNVRVRLRPARGKSHACAIGFDVYGTLVDPLGMAAHLEAIAGDLAGQMAQRWREKQIEYTFRRALMQKYENFDVCTEQALVFAANSLNLELRDDDRATLLEAYRRLPSFPDALPAIRSLNAAGFKLAAFSNGVESIPARAAGSRGHSSTPGRRDQRRRSQNLQAQAPRVSLPGEAAWISA